jgi:hypothetical protein
MTGTQARLRRAEREWIVRANNLLAGSAFAGDQYGCVGCRHSFNERAEFYYCGMLTDEGALHRRSRGTLKLGL